MEEKYRKSERRFIDHHDAGSRCIRKVVA